MVHLKILKVSDDVSLVEEISTHKVLVDSVGLWNGSDEDVFKKKVEKKFRNSLRGKKNSIGRPF
jgi:hypothetical protein